MQSPDYDSSGGPDKSVKMKHGKLPAVKNEMSSVVLFLFVSKAVEAAAVGYLTEPLSVQRHRVPHVSMNCPVHNGMEKSSASAFF